MLVQHLSDDVVAFPALQCVVFDLFIVRPTNKSNLSKDLETQQEVVISMLLRLLQHHQVVVSSVLSLTTASCRTFYCGQTGQLFADMLRS